MYNVASTEIRSNVEYKQPRCAVSAIRTLPGLQVDWIYQFQSGIWILKADSVYFEFNVIHFSKK